MQLRGGGGSVQERESFLRSVSTAAPFFFFNESDEKSRELTWLRSAIWRDRKFSGELREIKQLKINLLFVQLNEEWRGAFNGLVIHFPSHWTEFTLQRSGKRQTYLSVTFATSEAQTGRAREPLLKLLFFFFLERFICLCVLQWRGEWLSFKAKLGIYNK